MMKRNGKGTALLLAMLMLLTFSVTPLFAAGDQTFKDVPESAWYHGYVEMLFEKEIVKGYGDTGEFRPDNKLTREHAAKMVALAAGLPYQGKKADFPDVDKEGEMSPYIAALQGKEAIQGFPDGTFKPKNNIQRGHAAKIVALAFGLLEGDMDKALTDLPQDAGVKTAIEILESNGVVKGYGNTKLFKPEEEINRAEFSKILCIAMVVASIQKAEADPAPEHIAAAEALLEKLPEDEDDPTRDYLQGRLDDLEEEEPTVIEVTVSKLAKDHYDAGDTLTFKISGLKPDEEVRVGMPIFLGHGGGWPWASGEHVLTTKMEDKGEGLYWFGTTDGNGVLTVTGIVGPDLSDGVLHITLPDYGYYIDSAIELQDEQGKGVTVG